MTDLRRFLRLSLRARRDPRAAAEMRAVAAGGELDWGAIEGMLEHERVTPLLYRAWGEETFVPAAMRTKLRQRYLANAHRNMILLREVQNATAALGAAGVPVVVLKGAALAEVVYGNIALRPLMDVDLLMRREHLEPALRVLAECGFATAKTETRAGAAAAYENELLLLKPGLFPVPIEIHWSLFDSPWYQQHLDLEWCWRTAVRFPFGAGEALMLAPVAQLLHLCGHLMLHHGGEDLLWEHDICEFITLKGPELDWEALIEQARACDLVIAVQTLVLRAAEVDAAPVPRAVLERLRQLRPSADERRITGYLTAEDRSVAQRFWTDIASMESWSQRLGYAWTHLFPSSQYMRDRYHIRHPALVPLYYPYRWFRGLVG